MNSKLAASCSGERNGTRSTRVDRSILLILTGCRLSENQKLRWEYVDLNAGELRLRDAKTDGRAVPLAPSAVRLLADLPRHADNPWVIVGKMPGSHLTDLQHPWRRIRARAELADVRIHDLRHSYTFDQVPRGQPVSSEFVVFVSRYSDAAF